MSEVNTNQSCSHLSAAAAAAIVFVKIHQDMLIPTGRHALENSTERSRGGSSKLGTCIFIETNALAIGLVHTAHVVPTNLLLDGIASFLVR